MRSLLLLLLLLLPLASAWSRPWLKRTDLEVIDGHFVRIKIGSPERTYAFYLDLEHNDIILNRADPELQSNSFEVRANGARSDLFMLGNYDLRLPYKIGSFVLERAIQLSSTQNPVGKLGLGAHSPLWRYWGNFTLTNNRLRLGHWEGVGDDDTPALLSGAGYCENPETGTGAGMTINFGILNLLLPHSLNEEHPTQLLVASCQNPHECPERVEITVHNQDISLIGGLSFTAVDLSHDGLVHLGRRFFYDIHLFVDWSLNTFIISDLAEFNRNFTALYIALNGLALIQWMLLRQHQGKDRPEMEKALVFLLETVNVALGLAHWSTNFFIYDWGLAIAELLDRWQTTLAQVYVHSTVGFCTLLAIYLLHYEYKHVFKPAVKPYHFVWHVLALANICVPGIWSAFVQHHHVIMDMGFMLFWATLLVLFNGCLFFHACLFGSKPLRFISGLLTASSYTFLSLCNVLPFYNLLYLGESRALFVLQYLLLFCFLPTLLIVMYVLRQFVRRSFTTAVWGMSRPDDFISQFLMLEAEQLF